ncbi:MAG: HD domain-containing protein [Acidobacteriota bacterium]
MGGGEFRCAALDVGSNAIRFLAARFLSGGTCDVLEAGRSPVRLGHGVFVRGELDGQAAARAVAVLSEYRRRMEDLGIARYRAVATSAVRESRNGEAFLAEVRERAGIRLEPIGGSEEARLVYRAVKHRMDLGTRRWLLVDVGGGSVEVALADRAGILWSESHTMGAVRLLEELAAAADDAGRLPRLLSEYVGTLRLHRDLSGMNLGCIATGGNAEALAALALCPREKGGVARLGVGVLERLTGRLAALGYRERIETLGIREDRADVILPAALVYLRLARLAGAREIRVPFVGLREGVVLELAEAWGGGDGGGRSEAEVEAAALPVGRKYGFDESHGRHVSRLALSLFDQTKELHRLGPPERAVLQAAALLHDVGTFVSYNRHHKHSLYLIANSELAGFSPRETLLVANVARYHRRSPPKPQHESFALLDRRERRTVRVLASLLRLADALDREHRQRVHRVEVSFQEGHVRLAVEGEGDLLLEGWSMKRKADLFRRTFGTAVEVSVVEGAP